MLVPLASNADMGNEGKLSSNKMVQLVRRAAVKRAAHGFALGESIVQELISSGMRPVDVTSIYNPVSEEFFQQESSHRLALKQITFVGVVGDRKQALLVLDVLAILRSKGLDARCAFYGPFENDAFAERFKTRLQKLKLENAVQHVPFTDSIHQVLLNDSSLFLLPSRQEGIPGALVEAMSAGVPCVVTNVGSMGSVVQEAGAGKVVPSDRDAIAEACLQLLSNPTLWHSESKKLKIFASENFRSQSVAAKYMGVLKKIR